MNSTKASPSGTNRKTAIIVGVLFIIGTVAGVLSGVFTTPIQNVPDYLGNVSRYETQWITGTLLILLMGLSLAMVPVMLYPVFKKHNETLAFGSVLFRGVLEAVCETLLVISFFLLLSVSEIYAKSGAAGAVNFQTLGSLLIAAGNWIQMIGGIVFSIGTLMICILFFQTRLIPRWLSGWGLIGAVLYFVVKMVSMFAPLHIAPDIGSGIGLLLIPTAIQEMVFAVWLIVKGFNATASVSPSVKTALNEI
jgi:hypothetical protein